jgi:Matrixin
MKGKWSKIAGAVAGAGLAFAWAPHAKAFCLTKSCELGEEVRKQQGKPACARDPQQCVTEGQPLHWADPCIQYAVQADGSANTNMTAEELQHAAAEGFAAWEGVACPNGGSPRFHAQFQGYVQCNRQEVVCGDASKNVNVIQFHDSGWPERSGAIGLTTPSGLTKSGTLNDADLELNSQDYSFDTPSHPGSFSLRDTLAHEIGHFLGLSHSHEQGALMSEHYDMLQLSRELLTADDVAAICAAYPPGSPLSCAAPSAPAYDDCQMAEGAKPEACVIESKTHEERSGGCSLAPPHERALSLGPGVVLLLGFLRRRRGASERARWARLRSGAGPSRSA